MIKEKDSIAASEWSRRGAATLPLATTSTDFARASLYDGGGCAAAPAAELAVDAVGAVSAAFVATAESFAIAFTGDCCQHGGRPSPNTAALRWSTATSPRHDACTSTHTPTDRKSAGHSSS